MALVEWEALATTMQDDLVAQMREDVEATRERYASVYVEPQERKADEGVVEQHPRTAIEGYLDAQRKARELRNREKR